MEQADQGLPKIQLILENRFLAFHYRSTWRYCCYLSLAMAWECVSHFKVLQQRFLFDGQGAVR